MSTFRPEFVEVAPPESPDLLAGAVLRNLTREIPVHYEWRGAKSILIALLSFGVLPVIAWTRKFKKTTNLERQQYWHLAEWVRLNSGHPDGERLTKLAKRAGYRRWLGTIAWVLTAVPVFMFVSAANRYGSDWSDFKAMTYSHAKVTPNHIPLVVTLDLYKSWVGFLAAAYALHWLQIQWHVARVRAFVRVMNEVAGGELIRPVDVQSLGIGFRPLWLAGGLTLALAVGAWWAIPMVLVGVLQTRWRREGRRIRGALADQLRQMLMLRRPAMAIPRLPNLGRFCENDKCRGRVSPQSRYCPRCGLAVGVAA